MSFRVLHVRRTWLTLVVAFALFLSFVPSALASGIETKIGDVETTIYAPNVVWQATNAHVIAKFTNTGSKSVAIEGLFKFPEGKDTQFTYGTKTPNAAPKDGATQTLKELKPGESKYFAFTYIQPKGSAQVGQYTANVTLKVGDASKTIPWTFDVRPGQVFQAQTDQIVYTIYAISAGMLVFWFVYFKFFVNKKFNVFAGEQPE